VKVHNSGTTAGTVTVTSNAYRTDGPWTLDVPAGAGAVAMQHWTISDAGNWYDFTVTGDNFERRFAGRMETGKDSVSDPLMAAHL
jgi:phospholipase C